MNGEQADLRGARRGRRIGVRALAAAVGVVLALGLLGLLRRGSHREGALGLVGLGSACGDGRLDTGEECDDGNKRSDDGCLPDCRRARCGDGVLRAHVEECDDGNKLDGDGCSSACLSCASSPSRFSWPKNGHCYWRDEGAAPWRNAASSCAQSGGHLVTFWDDHEWKEIKDRLLGGWEPAIWIGLREEERNGLRDFAWLTGERVLSAHWTIQEPRRVPPTLDCAVQLASGAWAAADCAEPHAFVCERPAWVVAERSAHAYRGFVGPLRFEEARAACAAAGAHLVTLGDREEQAFVTTRFQGQIWIGAQLEQGSRRYGWITGERFDYNDYAPGEPNFVAQQRCVAMDVDRRWYNRECSERYNFVCEMD